MQVLIAKLLGRKFQITKAGWMANIKVWHDDIRDHRNFPLRIGDTVSVFNEDDTLREIYRLIYVKKGTHYEFQFIPTVFVPMFSMDYNPIIAGIYDGQIYEVGDDWLPIPVVKFPEGEDHGCI